MKAGKMCLFVRRGLLEDDDAKNWPAGRQPRFFRERLRGRVFREGHRDSFRVDEAARCVEILAHAICVYLKFGG